MTDDDLRVLPHDLAAEKSTLGAILLHDQRLMEVAPILRPQDFFRRGHQAIYRALLALDQQRRGVDLVTLTDALTRAGELEEAGGRAYVSALTDGVPRGTNVTHYAEIVREKSQLRAVIALARDVTDRAYREDANPTEILSRADRTLMGLQHGDTDGGLVPLQATAGTISAQLEHRYAHRGELLGIETGFRNINDVTFGWQPGDLIVIAARPSIGKSALTLNSAVAAAKSGKHAAIFSLEMRRRQVEVRILAHLAQVDKERIQTGGMSEDELGRVGDALALMHELPLSISDRSGQSVSEIRAACRRMRADGGLDLVVIDYVQLMPGSLDRRGANRNDEITDISRRLKALAGELSVPVLLLSQLSRASEQRADQRPKLSDLRESGALEQDADLVGFLHRAHHRASGKTSFIIEKHRDGDGGTVGLLINRATQTFTDDEMSAEPAAEAPPPESVPSRRRRRP